MTGEPTYASTGAVAGLAREVETLRRVIDPLRELPGRLDELAALVVQLAGATAATASTPTTVSASSWLDLAPDDVQAAHKLLTDLTRWMEVVYLRYPDAAQSLPDCWLWHPDVVEELLWLMQAWLAAYRDQDAPVSLAGDWHDRYRPGVVRRINATAGRCSLESHQPRDHPATGGPVVPVTGAVGPIATWWGAHRNDP
ncbi:MAG: hypothetical protein ABR608_07605, partial [Pseudonocardiaceae bacterium]